MTDTPPPTFTDPNGNEVPEQEVRKLYGQGVAWAVRALCSASNTPVPEFAREPGDPVTSEPCGPAIPVQQALPLPTPGQDELRFDD